MMWTIERQLVQRDLVDYLYASAAEVPCERKAVMVGGLGGTGKAIVLEKCAGVDRSRYLTIKCDGCSSSEGTSDLELCLISGAR
jgi:hypothetical protein